MTQPVDDQPSAAGRIGSSAIRDLLRLTEQPGILSLAGGVPAAEAFPVAALEAASARVFETGAAAALQYGPTEGHRPLREWIAAYRHAPVEHVVVTAGSQQALDLLARTMLVPGDAVALAEPAYVGALQVLRAAGADLLGVPADDGGLDVDALAARLQSGRRPRLVYTVSDHHNPTGATLAPERRAALAALAESYGFTVVEDDPYGELRWTGARPVQVAQLTDRVVTLGSFSKVLAPGLRVGYLVAPPALARNAVIVKQAADLHTGSLAQRLVHDVVAARGFLAAHLAGLRALYADRATALADALDAALGERVRFARPDGGLFLWVEVPEEDDTAALLAAALERGVAFVPGEAFAVDPGSARLRRSLRLSFASLPPAAAGEAATRLAAALDDRSRARRTQPGRLDTVGAGGG